MNVMCQADLRRPFTVVRLGGSLLTLPDLVDRLQGLRSHVGKSLLIVVGGGATVDLMRILHAKYGGSDLQWHWHAVRRMSENARILARVWSHAAVVATLEQAAVAWESDVPALLNVEEFLRRRLCSGKADPGWPRFTEDWNCTSDSIAAWVAAVLSAQELLVLKSADPPGRDLTELSRLGYVDPLFPRIASRTKVVRFVNLRSLPLEPNSPAFLTSCRPGPANA
ncbi:MAG: hypothetical protein KDA96_02055 [Planctomycetaceae bacterium]|nr:hypothetical protein [Planctomycetaceae bacterium]